jgi:Peptidase A4 family
VPFVVQLNPIAHKINLTRPKTVHDLQLPNKFNKSVACRFVAHRMAPLRNSTVKFRSERMEFTMFLKSLASLLALGLVPALAQVSSPTTPASSDVTASNVTASDYTPLYPIIPRQHAPRRRYGLRPDRVVGHVTVSDSTNWSGYAVTGTSFTQALGSWVIPTVNCTKTPNTFSSFWVGIDGWNSNTVEQTGTDSDCNGKTPSYYAWYEFFPAASVVISTVPVSPGNKMSASVTWNSGTTFTLSITNESTGKSFSKSGSVSGAVRTSAEWIAEAPCCTRRGGILPLADFGTVSFGDDFTGVTDTNWASDSSITGPISDFGAAVNEAIMVNGSTGADEAVPSSLSTDGSSFTVQWDSE